MSSAIFDPLTDRPLARDLLWLAKSQPYLRLGPKFGLADPKCDARFVGHDWDVFRLGRILIDQSCWIGVLFSVQANIAESYGLRVYSSIDVIVAADAMCGKA